VNRIAAGFVALAALCGCDGRNPYEALQSARREHAAGQIASAERSYGRACEGGFVLGCVGQATLVFHRKDSEGAPLIHRGAASWLAECRTGKAADVCTEGGAICLDSKLEPEAGKAMLAEGCRRGSAHDCRSRGEAAEGGGDSSDARVWYGFGCEKKDGLSCVKFALVSGPDQMPMFSRGKQLLDSECKAGDDHSCRMAKAIEKGMSE
jgi:hypothetical protein